MMPQFVIDELRQELIDPTGKVIKLRPQSLDVFRLLLEHSNKVISKETIHQCVWGDLVVTDDSITQCIADIRRSLGDEYKKILQTVPKKGYRLNTTAETMPIGKTGMSGGDNQIIKFCFTSDNVRIAYSTLGSGPPVIFVANWLTHLKFDLQFPARRSLVEMLAENFTVIRYDARGNGLSDLDVANMSFEASILDLEAIVSDLELEQFSLIGQSQGAAIAAAYTARNTNKINKLAIYGGYARGRRRRGSKGQIAESEAFVTMIREGWGRDIDTYVQMFGTFFMPDANSEQLAGFTKFQRIATPPENAARIQFSIDDLDISDELSNINTPCLVLHVREDARASFEEGLLMAAAIPNSRFVPLEGRNHALLAGEPALQQYLEEIQTFMLN